jgi:HK97 family phage major capsid protein
MEAKDLLELIKQTMHDRDEAMKKVLDEIKTKGEAGAAAKAELEAVKAEYNKLTDRLFLLEQKISAPPETNTAEKTLGEQFTDSDDFKHLLKTRRGSAVLKVPSLQQKTTITSAAVGTVLRAQRLEGIITPQLRQFRVRDLMAQGNTTSNAIEYVKENVYTNAAAPTAETIAKPESALTFTVATAPVRTIAHWIPATKQVLDDMAQLRGYIDGRLIWGLEFVEETQLLSGDGTGVNVLGIIPQATAYDTALTVAGDTKIDKVRHAILQARLAEFPVDGIILNPTDWHDIELVKDTTDKYVFGDPNTSKPFNLWSRAIVETAAIAAGTFLVGAFRMAAQVWDREDANVEVSTEHSDFFVKNLVAIRAEERLALTVYRPGAFITGSF